MCSNILAMLEDEIQAVKDLLRSVCEENSGDFVLLSNLPKEDLALYLNEEGPMKTWVGKRLTDVKELWDVPACWKDFLRETDLDCEAREYIAQNDGKLQVITKTLECLLEAYPQAEKLIREAKECHIQI